MPRTTVDVSDEHREFLDKLPYGDLRRLISGLLDCTISLCEKYGEKHGVAYISGGIMQLTEIKKKGD